MHKKDIASVVLMVWMLAASNLMGVLYGLDLRLFIAITLVGFFTITYTIRPVFSKPDYLRNIDRMAVAGAALFGLVICLRILELIEYWS
jgi:hypothetical protein